MKNGNYNQKINGDQMVYQIRRIEAKDDVAGLSMGLALLLPIYSYDLLLGFTLQRSGSETLRFCKYKPVEKKIMKYNNIDFAKHDVKEELLIKITDALEYVLEKYSTSDEIFSYSEDLILDSSLKGGNLSNLVYSVCYYENRRHFGFCFMRDEREEPILRFFRVDVDYGSVYPKSLRKDYYEEHRYFGIALRDLKYRKFVETLLKMFLETLEIIQEGEPNFNEFPKYIDKFILF